MPMEKIWYILIDGKEEGPYSISDLKAHKRFDPDVLVRKAGSKRWMLARYIKDLKAVFEDDAEKPAVSPAFSPIPPSDEIAIDYREDPPLFYLWLLIAAALLVYTLVRFFEA